MAKKKQKPAAEDLRVLAEKDGNRRHFTMQQLEAMGKSLDGKTYNGWKVIDPPKKPSELEEDKTGPKGDKKPAGAKNQATKLTKDNEKTISGNEEGAAAGGGAGADGETGSDPAQGGEGDPKTD